MQALTEISKHNPDYWNFTNKDSSEHFHAYLQYPAMMVPQLQAKLLAVLAQEVPSGKVLYDPFMGSGTSMMAAILQGLDFYGADINPLAYLICKVKSGPFREKSLRRKAANLEQRIIKDCGRKIEVNFPGRDKWFTMSAMIRLSKIRRSIQKEPSLWARRFFWISLAETVRLVSNSRTSTFKLHIRPASELECRQIDPEEVFFSTLIRNLKHLAQIRNSLNKRNLLNRDTYVGEVTLKLADSSLFEESHGKGFSDFLVTSPPYGDNKTTVPYGQFSYLPLQWINLSDIDHDLKSDILSSTSEIDSRSLGGSLADIQQKLDLLADKSPSLRKTLKKLTTEPRDRTARLVAFSFDLEKALDSIYAKMKSEAYMCWVVGDRRVGGHKFPLGKVLTELLESRGVNFLASFERHIPSKRMAVRNNIAETMRRESILVMKKGTLSNAQSSSRY